MGRRKTYFAVEQAARPLRKIKRDQAKLKRLSKAPTAGQLLHHKMHGRAVTTA